ncbi:hypothetical protein EON65_14900 [archaeon]|nr:MAG: hypothetical protein EON65_14900 [archaeon]
MSATHSAELLSIGKNIFVKILSGAKRDKLINDLSVKLNLRYGSKVAEKNCKFFDNMAFTTSVLKSMEVEYRDAELTHALSTDLFEPMLTGSPKFFNSVRTFTLVYMIYFVSTRATDFFAKVCEVFRVEKLKELFNEGEEPSDFNNLGESSWNTLHRFAVGMCCIMAVHTGSLSKDIVITAAGHFAGKLASCSGNNPGKMALCYEYIYRCIGQQGYNHKMRRNAVSPLGPKSDARMRMIQLLPDLLLRFEVVLQACLSLLRECEESAAGCLGKRRRLGNSSSQPDKGRRDTTAKSFPVGSHGFDSDEISASSFDYALLLRAHHVEDCNSSGSEGIDEDSDYFPSHHDKRAINTVCASHYK